MAKPMGTLHRRRDSIFKRGGNLKYQTNNKRNWSTCVKRVEGIKSDVTGGTINDVLSHGGFLRGARRCEVNAIVIHYILKATSQIYTR